MGPLPSRPLAAIQVARSFAPPPRTRAVTNQAPGIAGEATASASTSWAPLRMTCFVIRCTRSPGGSTHFPVVPEDVAAGGFGFAAAVWVCVVVGSADFVDPPQPA